MLGHLEPPEQLLAKDSATNQPKVVPSLDVFILVVESIVKNRDSVESSSGDCRDHGVPPQAATHPLHSANKNSSVKGIQLPRCCRWTKT